MVPLWLSMARNLKCCRSELLFLPKGGGISKFTHPPKTCTLKTFVSHNFQMFPLSLKLHLQTYQPATSAKSLC